MLERPTLAPMLYRLWLPHCGAYVQDTTQFARRVIGAVNRGAALRMPEAQALREARRIIRRTGQVVELRPVDLTEGGNLHGEAGR